ncbi:MAG: Fe-S metabolism protein SufE [Thiotrichales bacterium 32-46-8]|jgi:SufE protein probably involved in Fe-S center assembly|nr:MAG: Fe-S metabolism protein SufE [Thiotrichales bacterium 32-46-8]OYY23955.1 MAG: Fe-S metabolism protein SufE [Thiotrichales bacterium 35-46-9]OYZ06065.1 MAG: Fe-S metabolism protein SufE [Thiotrichales bacterium 16-46-22]OZA18368.1 MAG: Fe-S metabolism protein SufE [Thiotrichales bacterium 17-46-47]OZA74920.1 MAG: Fe-S metabolism protein SufE [Thiotrichales bacterium 39-47-5]OZA95967.1 MAG: Fe-S metabolism protein SufE [Thiotrichales bacterium 34-46-19]UCG19313.1 MAG: SufE family protei
MDKPVNTPPKYDIQTTIEQLVERFAFFNDWKDRYQYLIDLGKKLPPFNETWQTEANQIHGCQSQVWLKIDYEDGRYYLRAKSEATIVAGMIALLLWVYNGRTKEEILTTPLDFLGKIGLMQHLSPSRANGLYNMIKHLHSHLN